MMRVACVARPLGRGACVVSLVPLFAGAQVQQSRDVVVPSLAPAHPLPPESATAAVTKFSFITYGDTRGRHDGVDLQAEHTVVVESMVAAIRKSATGPDPIRFVLQSGDAVQDGEPDLRDYLAAGSKDKVALEHLARPSSEPGANPFHDVIAHIDGERISLDVVGVDWGKGFAPYRSSTATMSEGR